MKSTFYAQFGKRWLDLAFSIPGIVLLSPVLIGAAISIRLSSRGPVLFRQVRVGKNGATFHILKFRTMIENESVGATLVTAANDRRITPVGRFLRNTKIDELPQLWNVFCGDMSLVGPRPEVPKFTSHYTAAQRTVLLAKPGVTGPAAIAFVNEEAILAQQSDAELFYRSTVLPSKLQLDLAYCGNICLSNDMRLLFSTVGKLFGLKRALPRVEPVQSEIVS